MRTSVRTLMSMEISDRYGCACSAQNEASSSPVDVSVVIPSCVQCWHTSDLRSLGQQRHKK